MKKLATFLLLALCLVTLKVNGQSTATLKAIQFPKPASFSAMSDNGKWATAKGVGNEDSSQDAYPFLVNIETGEIISLWEDENDYIGVWDVTDDGKIVVGNKDEQPAFYNTDTKEWKMLAIDTQLSYGSARSITPDGNFIVGYGSIGNFGSADYQEKPLLWEKQSDGSYKFIDAKKEFEGFPQVDKSGKTCNMTRITMISPDGNILAGVMNFIYPIEQTTYVYNKTTKEYKFVDKLLPTENSYIEGATMSNNGKYLTSIAYIITEEEEYNASCVYDVEKDELTVYNETSEEKDRGGNVVSNSGILYGTSPAVNPARSLYFRVGNFWYGIDELLAYKYGINFYESLNYDYTGFAVGVSDDEKTMLAMSSPKIYGYVITLPEKFQDAAKSINLLKTYKITPESGSVFAKFKEAVLVFAKATEMKSGAQAILCDENGQTVKTYSISANDETKYVIGGMAYSLADGKKYTLKIPAGTFTLKGDNTISNEEITVTYTGRENKPVTIVQASPADNSNVSELSSTNPLQITFDINVAVQSDATAYLYQESSDTPIATLSIASSGKTVAFFPAVKRYLTKGVNYRIEIPEGIITDIMGYCANEAITINYTGSYEQQIEVTDGTIFNDDFNDVSNSMVRYLLYEGDHNTPTQEMQGIGFDKDNTPWNFTIRESEDSNDYCVASTSSYNPAGKSDDWMSLPQLYIENDKYYLEFDAQSYRKSKTDVLKIYALTEDATYDVFTKDLYNKFKESGKVIFEETLETGNSEDYLSDEWQSFSINLEEFAGKNVYLAFVNENEDQSLIFVDNVKVAYHGDFLIGMMSPTTVVNKESTEIKAFIKVTGDKTYNDLSVTCSTLDGEFSDTYEAKGLALDKNSEIYTFTFEKELPLTVGTKNEFKLSAILDGIQYSIQPSINNLAFEPIKRVLIEEGTGTWCGNCPLGILAIEHLKKVYGEQVIPVAIHNDDPMAYPEYESFLGFSSYPTGTVNRIDTLYAPAISTVNGETQVYSYTSDTKNKTFEDIVIRELEEPTYSDVSIAHAIYDESRGVVEVKTSLKYAMDMPSLNQNLSFIIIENGVSGIQNNYFYNNSDPFFEEWGKDGEYGKGLVRINYNEVARKVIGPFSGIVGSVPSKATANTEINYLVQQAIPGNVSNWENAEVVVALIDANTGKIVNAAMTHFEPGVSGIESTEEDNASMKIYGYESNVNIEFEKDCNATVSIYDINGRNIVNTTIDAYSGDNMTVATNLSNGLYIVKAVTEEQTIVKKIMIR